MAWTIWFSNWNFRFSRVNGKYPCLTLVIKFCFKHLMKKRVLKIKKNIYKEDLCDLTPNSQNWYYSTTQKYVTTISRDASRFSRNSSRGKQDEFREKWEMCGRQWEELILRSWEWRGQHVWVIFGVPKKVIWVPPINIEDFLFVFR